MASDVALYQHPDRFAAEALATAREQEPRRIIFALGEFVGRSLAKYSRIADIAAVSHWSQPVFAALSVSQAIALIEVQIGELQIRDFRGTAAGSVEQFEQCSVAAVIGVVGLGARPIAGRRLPLT